MLIICKFSISCDVYMEIESLKNTFRASPRLASIHEFLFLQAWRKYFIPRFVFRPGPLRPRGHKYLSLSAFLQIASLASQLLCLITCIYSSMARLLHSRTKIQFCHACETIFLLLVVKFDICSPLKYIHRVLAYCEFTQCNIRLHCKCLQGFTGCPQVFPAISMEKGCKNHRETCVCCGETL